MKSILAILATLTALIDQGHSAPCRSRVTVLHGGQQVITDSFGNQIAITAFAQPLAVPVASVTPGAAMYSTSHDTSQLLAAIQALEAKIAAIEARGVGSLAQQSAIGSKCASCHSGEQAKKGFRVDIPMSDDVRLKAISMILAKKMPPKTPLSPRDVENVLTELSARPADRQQEK